MSGYNQAVAVSFILLLCGSEAARINMVESIGLHAGNAGAEAKTPDLDFPGCAGFTCSNPGCHHEYVWLDTPRQSCRFTEEWKLNNDQVKFMKTELARLEEKSVKFQRTGCIFGTGFSYDTYMFKCYRRMRQIMRLMTYFQKAKERAEKDDAHPAHEYATSAEVKDSLSRIAANLASGFEKYEVDGGDGTGLKFKDALDAMLHVREKADSVKEECADCDADEAENLSKDTENVLVTEAMLKMVDVELNEEQRTDLAAKIRDEDTGEEDAGNIIHSFVEDIDRGMMKGPIAKEADNNTALIQTGDASQLAARGMGPLKWLWKYGIGWLVSRICWVVLFVLGSALNIIKAGVVFPLLFLGCTLYKFIAWLGYDLIYQGGVEGEWQIVGEDFLKIGKCAPWMWSAVGFDPKLQGGDLPGQIVVQPAMFASRKTGVHHAWKTAEGLCEPVKCGLNAVCDAGECRCIDGYYPDGQTGNCGLATTTHGCVCMASWLERNFMNLGGLFRDKHHGCPRSKRKCKVLTSHATYATCESKLSAGDSNVFGAAVDWATGAKWLKEDSCEPALANQKVPALSRTS